MKILTAMWVVLALASIAAAPAFAQKAADPLESRLVARKVVVVQGRESLADAGAAKPGDVIEYVASYRNTGKDAITGLQATMPIPSHTEYLPGTARPAKARASLDGQLFAGIPLKRSVTRDAKLVEEPVPYREYRYLRWLAGELRGGKSVSFTARVRVVDDRPSNEPGSRMP